jgi:two-component system sensor histidine kinase BaeS
MIPGNRHVRLSIGHRLFASVLLAILAVATSAIMLLRQQVTDSFSEYAQSIELDRLGELSSALAAGYQAQGGWGYIGGDQAARQEWVVGELARLQRERAAPAPPTPPATPAAVASPAAVAGQVAPPVPPVPPAPPAPPLPPLPPPAIPADAPVPAAADAELPLQQRVTLLDASGAWLAGRRPGAEPAARRAILAGGQPIGYLAVARAPRPSDALASAFLQQLKDNVLLIAAASIALSALAAVLLAAHFRRPIGRLNDGARLLAEGRFDTRLPTARSDELGELARSFNRLAETLGAAEDARRQWVADTSHELRTPLSVLRAQLEAIQDGVRPAGADSTAAMLRQVMSLNALIDQLYALARADVGELACHKAPLDLWQLACQQAAAFGDKFDAAGLALEAGTAPAAALVMADPERMRQLFANLFENSIRYSQAGGSVALHSRQDGAALTICVDDSAPAVPGEALAKLGQRFYRVDDSRSRALGGAGLGLALCRRIAEAHGGQLAFAQSPLGGLRVLLSLPLAPA